MLYIKLSDKSAEIVARISRLGTTLSIVGVTAGGRSDDSWKSAKIVQVCSASPGVFASYRDLLASVARGFLIGKSIYPELLNEA
jgi:hypothetical protein